MYKNPIYTFAFLLTFVFTEFIPEKNHMYMTLFWLTFTWEVCAPTPTGSKATDDDGLDFLPPERTWFRVLG
jgi:hypothetical protein